MKRNLTMIYDALNKTVYGSDKSLKEIAYELDYSPSELSRRCNHEDKIVFPLDKLPDLMRITSNYTILEVLAEQSGYELKAKEISLAEIGLEIRNASNTISKAMNSMAELMKRKDES